MEFPHPGRCCRQRARLTLFVAATFVLLACGESAPDVNPDDLVDVQIDYLAPDASAVDLVWGFDGWNALPDGLSPDARRADGVMHTPMRREADRFVATVRVPRGSSVDFGFLITQAAERVLAEPLWDEAHSPLPPAASGSTTHEVAMPDSLRQRVSESGAALVTRTLRYAGPEADSVDLVWGISGWQPLPEALWPPGTRMPGPVMQTRMVREGAMRVAELRVPAGSSLDFGFLLFGGIGVVDTVGSWIEGQTARSVGEEPVESIEFEDRRETLPAPGPGGGAPAATVTHEIRYVAPRAGRVLLVWGINGWGPVGASPRPEGTEVVDDVMQTPMRVDGDAFVVELDVPSDARVDYGFLITHDETGRALQPVWDGESAQALKDGGGTTRVSATVDIESATPLPTVAGVLTLALAGLFAWALLALALGRLPRKASHTAVALTLLTVAGFALRAYVASTTERLAESPAELIGDETRYDFLATEVVEGRFFQAPLATPVYPLFLAAHYQVFGHRFTPVLYSQALLGALLVPLVYLLALLTIGRDPALAAASLTAFLPALIETTGYLYTEVMFTFWLVASMVALVWALRTPGWRRFAVAGILVGLAALTRPSIAMWPLALPLLLPRTWSLRQRGTAWVAYGVATAATIAPWTVHNFRTLDTFLPLSLTMATLWHGSPEFYHVMESRDNAMVTVWANELNPAVNGGHDPMTVEGDRYFSARAKEAIRAEPGLYARYSIQKLAYFWVGHPAATYEWPFDWPLLRDSMSTARIAYLYSSRFVLLLGALFGVLMLGRRFLLMSPLALQCLYLMGVHAVLVPVVRHSEPLYPFLAIMTAAGLEAAWRRLRGGTGSTLHEATLG